MCSSDLKKSHGTFKYFVLANYSPERWEEVSVTGARGPAVQLKLGRRMGTARSTEGMGISG